MGFVPAIRTCFAKYATFSGRARRPEYWWFLLFLFLGSALLGLLDRLVFGAGLPMDARIGMTHFEGGQHTRIFQPLFQIATVVPGFAVGWRRMHDTGRPGWYLLLPLIASVLLNFVLLGGMVGFGMWSMGHFPGERMLDSSMLMGGLALALTWLLQLALFILVIWWLTRPSQPGDNRFGPEPPRHPKH